MILGDFLSAFRAGSKLANSETWKRRQNLVNAIVVFLGAVVSIAAAFGYPINLDQGGIRDIAGAIAAVVGVFNIGATVATTDTIGLSPRSDVLSDGRSDAEPDGSGAGADGGSDRGSDGVAGSYAGPDDQVPYLGG